MEDNKKYKYKLWLEVERVEIDEDGKEIGEFEQGPFFGYEPEELHLSYDLKEMDKKRDKIIAASIWIE